MGEGWSERQTDRQKDREMVLEREGGGRLRGRDGARERERYIYIYIERERKEGIGRQTDRQTERGGE